MWDEKIYLQNKNEKLHIWLDIVVTKIVFLFQFTEINNVANFVIPQVAMPK